MKPFIWLISISQDVICFFLEKKTELIADEQILGISKTIFINNEYL